MTFTQEAAVLLVHGEARPAWDDAVRKIAAALRAALTGRRGRTPRRLFLELVHTYGLPEPERQVVISGVEGFIGTVDFAWR